jgi:hypothetical protein
MEISASNATRRGTAAERETNFPRGNTETSDGVTINFVETGNRTGPPILFVHGISQSWRPWTKQLNDEALLKIQVDRVEPARSRRIASSPLMVSQKCSGDVLEGARG